MSRRPILDARPRLAGLCRRWSAETLGVSAAEYAVMLALAAACLLAAASALGPALNTTYRRLAQSSQVLASAKPGVFPHAARSDGAARRAAAVPAASHPTLWRRYAPAGLGLLAALLALGLAKLRQRREASDREASEAALPKQTAAAIWKKRQQILRVLSNGTDRIFTDQLDVGRLMTLNVHTVQPATSVDEVRELMLEKDFRHLLVCGADGRLEGVISDRDLKRSGRTASDIMTPDPITIAADTPVNQAMSQMLHRKISCLPVCREGRLVGAMTTTDLIMTLQCVLQLLQTIRGVAMGSTDAPQIEQEAPPMGEAPAAPVA